MLQVQLHVRKALQFEAMYVKWQNWKISSVTFFVTRIHHLQFSDYYFQYNSNGLKLLIFCFFCTECDGIQ